MTKIEELKAAFEAVTPGEWMWYEWENKPLGTFAILDEEGGLVTGIKYSGKSDHQFIALSHNLMPQLLEAVELLKAVVPLLDIVFDYEGDVFGVHHNDAGDAFEQAKDLLESLK